MRTLYGLCVALFTLGACTQYGYVKPGITDEEFVRDSQECAEIARRQAFHDYASSRWRFTRRPLHSHPEGMFSTFDDPHFSMTSLEWDYRRVCMLSRGYVLAPLEDDEGGEEEPDVN